MEVSRLPPFFNSAWRGANRPPDIAWRGDALARGPPYSRRLPENIQTTPSAARSTPPKVMPPDLASEAAGVPAR
jgi:hypothetical protein